MLDLKNFKVLVFDFDGTLVDTSLIPTEKTRKAVKELIGKGYIFSLATGRPYQGIIRSICGTLNLTAPQIVSGGSVIINPKTADLLWCEYIAQENVRRIVREFLDYGFEFAVDSQGKYIFTPKGSIIRAYGQGVIFKQLAELDYGTVSKITLEGSNILNLKEKAEELSGKFPDMHIIRSGMKDSPVLDITSIKATKHLAVLELSKILNIDPKFMIGVGDGYNDYPLLSVCGFKAAMGSAPKELKEIADLILPDVSHDGLAVLISKILS